ncbi:MAG TPA: hypothetical protein VN711_02310 [Candidatus Saccharimonadales bacterium]|nr:hypothetical protein [Candidatus Saccharimonadales bacterium]
MAIRVGREGIFGFRPARTREQVIPTVHVGSFPEAVDSALALQAGKPAIDVIGLDLDRTYVHWKDVFAHPLQSIGVMGVRREQRIRERQDALHRLLEPKVGQRVSKLVVWTSRPEWAVPRGLRRELETIAGEHSTTVTFVGGLEKLGAQQRFRNAMTRIIGEGGYREVAIIGNSRQEHRGSQWVADNLGAHVYNISIGRRRFNS